MATDVAPEVAPHAPAPAETRRPAPWRAIGTAAVAAVVALGIVARFVARSHLWLDEALTVNIAALPLRSLPEALRHDGSPPLYYVVLHFWIRLFGTGTIAVRALSGVCSAACLPLAWRVGRRLGGRTLAVAVLVLLALSPFAVQYATMLLALAGGLALANMLERPSLRLGVAVALATGALLLTHYYALYTVAAVGLVLLWYARRGEERAAARWALAAMVAGGLLFLPWVPVLLYQSAHTGAPWGNTGRGLRTVVDTLGVLTSGYRDAGPVPLLLAVGLIAFAAFTLITVASMKQGEPTDTGDVHSGAGGYRLMVTTGIPLLGDLNSVQGRRVLGMTRPQDAIWNGVRFVNMRRRVGQDAGDPGLQSPHLRPRTNRLDPTPLGRGRGDRRNGAGHRDA